MLGSAKPIAIVSLLGLTSFTVFLWALSSNSAASVIAFRECSTIRHDDWFGRAERGYLSPQTFVRELDSRGSIRDRFAEID